MISASSRSFNSNLLIVVVDVAVFIFELSSFKFFEVKTVVDAVSDLFSVAIGAGGGAGAIFFLVRVNCDVSMLCIGSFSLSILLCEWFSHFFSVVDFLLFELVRFENKFNMLSAVLLFVNCFSLSSA